MSTATWIIERKVSFRKVSSRVKHTSHWDQTSVSATAKLVDLSDYRFTLSIGVLIIMAAHWYSRALLQHTRSSVSRIESALYGTYYLYLPDSLVSNTSFRGSSNRTRTAHYYYQGTMHTTNWTAIYFKQSNMARYQQ